jgi:FkbM family methyltransferase
MKLLSHGILTLKRLPNYVRRFGAAAGLRQALRVELTGQTRCSGRRFTARIPSLPSPVNLRETRGDLATFWQVLVNGEYDFSEFSQAESVETRYNKALAAGRTPVVLDCGGNIGLTALWFHLRFPEAVIVSVEPDSGNFVMLVENTRPYERIHPVHGAVWSRSESLHIVNPSSGSASFRVGPVSGADELAVRGYSIEELLAEAVPAGRKSYLLAVKIDIEGAESEVFSGECAWMEDLPLLAIETHDWLLPGQGTSRNLYRSIARYRFDVIPGTEKPVPVRYYSLKSPKSLRPKPIRVIISQVREPLATEDG